MLIQKKVEGIWTEAESNHWGELWGRDEGISGENREKGGDRKGRIR